jgi:hypothetical protein
MGHMAIPLEKLSWLLSDSSDVVVQVDANDPRSCPTEALLVVVNSGATLAELERLPDQLREECGWGLGYEVDLSKRSGGIGADGLTLVGLVLGVVGAVPTVESILRKLGRRAPTMPDRDSALQTATWAVSMQYRGVPRNGLRVVREERHQDHWTLAMVFDASGDRFEVDVYGMPRSGAVATRVVWQDGDAWGRKPGEVGADE